MARRRRRLFASSSSSSSGNNRRWIRIFVVKYKAGVRDARAFPTLAAQNSLTPERRTHFAMDSVRRVLATYLVDRTDASSPASTSSSHGFPLLPRRLSTSFARATSSPGASSLARRVLDASEIAARAIGLKRGRESPSSGRASPSLLGGDSKRARGESARDVSVVQNEIDVEDEDVAPWPSAKRKRASSDVDEEEAPSAHRRRTSEVLDGRAATYATSARRSDAPTQPALLAERVLRNGRLDGFKNLPKMSSRVTVVPRRGKPSRRGVPYRGPSRGLGAAVEFEELPEDRAERERLEASKAPALGSSTTSAFVLPSVPATLSSKPKEDSSSGVFGAALAEFKSTVTSTSDAKTEPPKAPAPTLAAKAPAFVFGATPAPAASAPIPNPFAAPTAVAAAVANPFAGFTAGAPSSAPANGERRVVRARRPASRNL